MGKALGKIIVAVAVVFVGAEVIKKKCPELSRNAADKILKRLKTAVRGVKGAGRFAKHAFKEGYSSVKSTTASSVRS